eukprot:contig_13225_g3156
MPPTLAATSNRACLSRTIFDQARLRHSTPTPTEHPPHKPSARDPSYARIAATACLLMPTIDQPSRPNRHHLRAATPDNRKHRKTSALQERRGPIYTINRYATGSTSSMDGAVTVRAGRGPTGWRLGSTAFSPLACASRDSASFVFTRSLKSSSHRDFFRCSTRTWKRFARTLPRTFLLTSTPTAVREIVNTRPVLPW